MVDTETSNHPDWDELPCGHQGTQFFSHGDTHIHRQNDYIIWEGWCQQCNATVHEVYRGDSATVENFVRHAVPWP